MYKKNKILIINADDMGMSKTINTAIKTGYEKNIISGISLVACGDAFSDAIETLQRMNIYKIGAHLTITGCLSPCNKYCKGTRTITNKNGLFYKNYKTFIIKKVAGLIRLDEIYNEWKKQIEKIIKHGFKITHLDSHEHLHVYPDIYELTVQLAKEFGIEYIRYTYEPIDVIKNKIIIKNLYRYMVLNYYTRYVKKKNSNFNIICNDYLYGHYYKYLSKMIIQYIVETLNYGVSELIVHLENNCIEYKDNKVSDLENLLKADIYSMLKRNNISLLSHDQVLAHKKHNN